MQTYFFDQTKPAYIKNQLSQYKIQPFRAETIEPDQVAIALIYEKTPHLTSYGRAFFFSRLLICENPQDIETINREQKDFDRQNPSNVQLPAMRFEQMTEWLVVSSQDAKAMMNDQWLKDYETKQQASLAPIPMVNTPLSHTPKNRMC